MSPFRFILKEHGLKDTQPRRFVLEALKRMKEPSSPYDIQKWVSKKGGAVNAVTVYRILRAFEKAKIVHRHPCDGHVFLCSLPGKKGHHGILHCTNCGKTEEFLSSDLCRAEEKIARASRFQPSSHLSEILGTCAACAA